MLNVIMLSFVAPGNCLVFNINAIARHKIDFKLVRFATNRYYNIAHVNTLA
jgi:hypothetical protein